MHCINQLHPKKNNKKCQLKHLATLAKTVSKRYICTGFLLPLLVVHENKAHPSVTALEDLNPN